MNKLKESDGKKYGKLTEDLPSTLRVKEKTERSGESNSNISPDKEVEHIKNPGENPMEDSWASDVNFDECENLYSVNTRDK